MKAEEDTSYHDEMSPAAETEIPYLGLETCQEFQVLRFGKNSGSITQRSCMHHLNTHTHKMMFKNDAIMFI